MIEPAIVVIAYNRVAPLKRLLNSLAGANYPSDDITLHISIDASDIDTVKQLADAFKWTHGNKVVELKDENRGLLKHILECGQLTDRYGSIIVLEDDLSVAPGFYNYAVKANAFYAKDEKIAGVSLFTYPVEENHFYPFQPIQDDSDVHFIQVASSWGQSWNKEQWVRFKSWLIDNPQGKHELLPKYIQEWGSNSWKQLFISYLIDTDRFFVFPNTSYTTNFEEVGTHAQNTGLFNVNMYLADTLPRFKTLADANSVYDVYFELLPECIKRLYPLLRDTDFEVDLFGGKPPDFHSEFVLTTKRAKHYQRSFGVSMKPLIQNVLNEIEGTEIVLCRKEDLKPSEGNRFQLLTAPPIHLTQFSEVRKQKMEQVSLVLPVLDDQIDALLTTLNALSTNRFYNMTLIIVGSKEVEKKAQQVWKEVPVQVEYVYIPIQKVDDLLRVGIAQCTTDYCGWIQPGMLIDPQKMETVAKLFQQVSFVQIVHGIHEEIDEMNYAKLNTSAGRWTLASANSNKKEAANIRTEWVFWRRSLIHGDTLSNLTSARLFLELLKLNPVYLLALKLGDFANLEAAHVLSPQEVSEILSDSQYQPKGGVSSIFRPIFRFWFKRNVPFFRLFYKNSEELPLVIRYDFKNDSFYLDNY